MIGQTVSHYKILEKLGEGGMGIVYKAHDLDLDRFVALKFLPPELSRDPDSKARFINEAKAASKLQHENICTIHEIGQTEEGPTTSKQMFIVMDFYEGTILKEKLLQTRERFLETGSKHSTYLLSLDKVLDIAIQTAEGLRAAHARGIIHRDIKPSNIIITHDGKVKILDFGLARSIEHSGVTKTGQTPGTLAYMSPEQATGGKVDHRTDIWSLGVLLYEMIAGVRPFETEIGPALVYMITKEQPRGITEIRKEIPEALESIVQRALQKNPEERYQQMDELISDLQALKEGRSIAPATWKRRRARIIMLKKIRWVGLAAVLVVMVTLTLLLTPWTQSELVDSIAILPLVNLSGHPEQEYFADGITEALIGELQKISSLRVISRTSVMRYKNSQKPIPEIAKELNVKAIVEGSVLQEGDNIQIKVKLVQPSPEKQMWAETFQRKMESIIVLQGNVATLIARQIRANVTPQEEKYLSNGTPVNPEAYDAYLKGRQYRYMETVEALPKALSYCQLAVEKDSNFARAWAGLSEALFMLDVTIGVFPKYYNQARAAVDKALLLDSTLAEAHVALALVQSCYEFNWADAKSSFERAIKLNPNDWNARREYGLMFLRSGKTAEAIVQLQKPHDFDPLSNACTRELGLAYLMAGHHTLAKECFEKAIGERKQWGWSLQDFYNSAQDHLVWEYLREDSVEKAKELCRLVNPELEVFVDAIRTEKQHAARILPRLESLLDEPLTRSFYLSRVYWHWGEHDKAIAQVEEGCRIQPIWATVIPTDSYLKGINSDPRVIALMEKVGLHQ